jgi:hypothetical protein
MAIHRCAPALLGAVFLVAACATAYQPRGFTGGYSEQKLDSDVYSVSFGGNGHTSRNTVYRSWLYRCADITVEQGYDWFMVLGRSAPVSGIDDKRLAGMDFGSPEFERTKGGGYSAPVYIYSGGGGTVSRYSATAAIRLYRGSPEPGLPMAFVARDVMRDLGPEVRQIPAKTPGSGRVYLPEEVFGGPAGAVNTVSKAPARPATLDDLKDLLPAAP